MESPSFQQKYVLVLSYLGASYCGWQRQTAPASGLNPSIQETLEQAIERMTQEKVTVVASGRTDSGVHASGQVCHFVLKKKLWEGWVLTKGLNTHLPSDIRILQAAPISMDFHAQQSAQRKQYSYYFQQGPAVLPFASPYSWWIHKSLDVQAMQEGLNFLLGEHDFRPFQGSGAKPGPTVRTLLEAQVTQEKIQFPQVFPVSSQGDFTWVRVRVVGTGFLKYMVRGIAGTLLQIGEGRRPPGDMERILKTQDRQGVGPTAPGRALWLEKVWYPSRFDFGPPIT